MNWTNISYNKKDDGFNNSSKKLKEIQKKTYISYTQLRDLKDKDDNEIIQFFNKYKDISDVFGNTKFTSDMIDLMIELLSKISQVNSSPASIVLNQIFTNTDFLDVIRKKLKLEQYNDTKYLEVFYDISVLQS